MKRLVLLLLLAGLPTLCAGPTIAEQEKTLTPTLWKTQIRMGFRDLWIDLKVKKMADMKEQGAWGSESCDTNGCHIEVLAAESYPVDFPKAQIPAHQREVVMHECLHILLTSVDVPDDFQDKLIEVLIPVIEGKKK